MATLNLLPCGTTNAGNSGLENCGTKPAVIEYIIRHPVGTFLTPTDLATLGVGNTNSGIKAKIQAEDPFARFQVWGKWVGVADNSTEPEVFTYDDGSTLTTRDEILKVTFEHRNSICYHKQLIRQNNQEGGYLNILVDKNGMLWGGALDANGNFQGVPDTRFYTGAYKFATQTEPARFYTQFEVSETSQLNLFTNVVNAGPGIGRILQQFAVQDVTLVLGGTPSAGAYPILATVGCAGKALAQYDTAGALAVPAAWVVTNQLGATVTLLGVTKSGSNYILAADTTDADYVAATSLNIRLAAVAQTVSLYNKALVSQDVAGNALFNTPKV